MREKKSVGLDIGNRHINMVKLVRQAQQVKLIDFASVRLDSSLGKAEKISQLEKIIQEKRLTNSAVNLGISGESVIVRYIDLPKMRREEIGQSLKYEAQQYIPFKIEEVIFDYHILEPADSARKKMKVLLVAAKKEAIIELVELIREAGLRPNLIDVNNFSLINCFQFNGPQIKSNIVFALVNLGFDWINMNVLEGTIPFFTRDISILEDILPLQPKKEDREESIFESVRPYLTNIVRELRLSIHYYESEFEKQISTIYLNGEGAKDIRLVEFFSNQLEKQVQLWNCIQNLVIDSTVVDTTLLKQKSYMLALACGLALRREGDKKWSR